MSNLRSGPTHEFRPVRSTRPTAAATRASATAASSGPATTTRSRSTSRPPSGAVTANGRLGSASGATSASRPGSTVGFTSRTTRAGLGIGVSRASAPASSTAAATGIKRKTRATSTGIDAEQESSAAKRPALSSAFSAHVSQTSLNRQLLDAQAQITTLQNDLLDKQREVDRLEADLRLVASREEEEREARTRSEEELAQKTARYETELSSLKRKLAELEADHEDLDDAYSNLSHASQSKIASLNVELTNRDERISLLETHLKEAEGRVREEKIHARALEELLDKMDEGQLVVEGGEAEGEERAEAEEGSVQEKESRKDGEETETKMRIELKEPESSVADSSSVNDDTEGHEDDVVAGADADSEAEVEDISMAVETVEGDVTPTGDMDVLSVRSESVAESNVFYEGGQPEIEAYHDPGAPPYSVSSPAAPCSSAAPSTPVVPRSRSASIASTQNGSIASSSMSITFDGPPLHHGPRSPESSLSIASSSRLDPLSHIRRRLSLATPDRRRSSVGASRDREKDNEIIRAELARQTSHITSLEATNARLTSEVERLRARAEGTEVLREEKRELERQVETMEELRSRVAELEAATDEFAHREREWQEKLKQHEPVNDENSTPARTPIGVTQQLAQLRKAHTVLLDEHGELKATLRTNEVELAAAHEEAKNALQEAQRLQGEVEQLQDALSRKEKERLLVERDATFLRSLVSSYKNEEAADTSMEIGEDHTRPAETEKLEQRIAQLESLLSEYKATIETLEKEVNRLQRFSGKATTRSQEQWDQLLNRATSLEQAFKNAHAEMARQSGRVEELEQRLFELGGEIGGGRHIPPGTRVLSLRQNPAQEWADTRKEVLDRLKAENEALLSRLKEVEDSGLSARPPESDPNNEKAQFVPRASWEVLKKETEELQATLAQKEKRLLRLKQVYTAKSVEFREAIESILGLKLAFYPNGQVRLTSVYDLSATFVFQPTDSADKGGARLQLVATGDGGPQELEGLMNTWIRDEMCIPCFMSSVTLECYDKRKHEQRAAGLHKG